MPEEKKPSETVERLRESFVPLAAQLTPEDEPASTYAAGPNPK
jgi:hypothetical protein